MYAYEQSILIFFIVPDRLNRISEKLKEIQSDSYVILE